MARLAAHHLAYLRAVAEGLPRAQAAARYLGSEPDAGAVALRRQHLALVEQVRALARRSGDRRWRLIGLELRPRGRASLVPTAPAGSGAGLPAPPDDIPPALEEWAEAMGVAEFSHAEQLALYQEAFAVDRLAQRQTRLRHLQLDALRALAQHPGLQAPQPHDRLDDWFEPGQSRRLMASGLLLLQDLVALVQAGGRWWHSIPRVGQTKAGRIVAHLETLLPGATRTRGNPALALARHGMAEAVAGRSPSAGASSWSDASLPWATPAPGGGLPHGHRPALPGTAEQRVNPPAPGQPGTRAKLANAPPSIEVASASARDARLQFSLPAGLAGQRNLATDVHAVRAWIAARAGSSATVKSYRRELGRFLLFLEQRSQHLAGCRVDDCLAYTALLQNVPPDWTGRRASALQGTLWSPFAGPLSARSQHHARVVVGACFTWLVAAGYLEGNPWQLVNRRTGDDPRRDELASRAFTPETWQAVLTQLQAQACGKAGAARMAFLLPFLEATGLRAAELLGARLGDLQQQHGQWWLQVHGKGQRNRVLPLPPQAERALAGYLGTRGLDWSAVHKRPALPVLASLTAPDQPISYNVLYRQMKAWVSKALTGTALGWADKVAAERASLHWLRHTCGTRALERGVPLDVVGQLLGHADPRTTARYTRAQQRRVAEELGRAFG